MDFDVVMPKGNEEEFIEKALELGYHKIVFLSSDLKYRYSSDKIDVKRAYLVHSTSEIYEAKHFDLMFAQAERKYFESDIDYIIGAELSEKRDSFHYRNTLLNQVHAKLARENNIGIVFDFGMLLDSCMRNRQILLGRMLQDAGIAKKYRLDAACFSLAGRPSGMRSRNILDAFSKILGL